MRTTRFSLVIVAMATALLSIGATAPATAAGGSSGINCPLKNGPGDIFINDVVIDMMANDMILGTNVLKKGADAEIVCVASTKNMGYASYYVDESNGTNVLDYQSFGVIGTDQVVVGTVDKDGIYNSHAVPVNVTAVQLSAPTVVQKAIKKHGKVIKPAIVSFTNISTQTIQVMAGDATEMEPRIDKLVAPGATIKFKTKLAKVDFVQLVMVGNGKGAHAVMNSFGQANSLTGKVMMENLWYTDDMGVYGRKAGTPTVAAPLQWLKS